MYPSNNTESEYRQWYLTELYAEIKIHKQLRRGKEKRNVNI